MVSKLQNNRLLITLTGTAFILAIWLHRSPGQCLALVDWKTIVTLSGLLIITTGIKESGFFNWLAYKILKRLHNERTLALSLIFTSFLLSMFLTNDIALFITIPLTLSFQSLANNDYSKLIIFEALAVNSGSSLTPIGNPQNIFLWHQWGIGFLAFVFQMLPLMAVFIPILILYTIFFFPNRLITISNQQAPLVQRFLFIASAFWLIVFVGAIEFRIYFYFLPVIVLFYLWLNRTVVFKADWRLIALFLLLFVNIRLLFFFKDGFPFLKHQTFTCDSSLLLSAAFLSQLISNVPATIFLTHLTTNYKILAYGVNIGGNGLFIASFANVIALGFIKKRNKYRRFHLYSISYFVVTFILLWAVFKVFV